MLFCQLVASAHSLQVPRDITEEQLAPLFDQCGEVLHLNILRTQKGQSSGMAWLLFPASEAFRIAAAVLILIDLWT